MNRREAIERVALLMGGAVIGAEFFLSGCKNSAKQAGDFFDDDEKIFLDEIGETILPQTSTPGARAAGIGAFMDVMVRDCYTKEDQKIFREGLTRLDELSKKEFGAKFIECEIKERTSLLTKLDTEQREYNNTKVKDAPNHYFRMLKELTLLGYFTSETGCKRALRYLPVPGKYIGIISYKKGDKAWAT